MIAVLPAPVRPSMTRTEWLRTDRIEKTSDPVRFPPWPPPVATLRPLPSPLTGLPRLPEPPFRRAVPTTPADRAGARVDCFPAHAAFPKWQEGRLPHWLFRGLLRLHSRYGRPDCSAAQGDLCHEAPALPVTRPSCSSATRSIDNSLVESSSTGDPRLRGALPLDAVTSTRRSSVCRAGILGLGVPGLLT